MERVRGLVYSLLVLVLVSGATRGYAEANLPPPESPFISIGEDGEAEDPEARPEISPFRPAPPPESGVLPESSGRGSDGEAAGNGASDIFTKRESTLPSRYDARPALPLPRLSWQWHSGGGYRALAEVGDTLFIAADQFIHIWDRSQFTDKGQLNVGKPIAQMDAFRSGDRHFLLVNTATMPAQLMVLEYLPGALPGAALTIRQTIDLQGKMQVFPEGVFVESPQGLIGYTMQADGLLKEQARLSYNSGDRFYPFGNLFYLYRRQTQTLELWDQSRHDLLSSIALGGDPEPLLLLPEPADRAKAMLYVLQRQSATGTVGLDRIPIDSQSGMFIGPAESLSFSYAASDYRLDRDKGWVYLKGMRDSQAVWRIFDLKQVTMLAGEWPGTLAPYHAGETGIYLLDSGSVRFSQFQWQSPIAFSLTDRIVRRELDDVSELYLEADGNRLVFSGKTDAQSNQQSGFQMTTHADGTEAIRRLWSESSEWAGRIWQASPFWFLENPTSGALYITRDIESGAWQKLVFPGLADGKPLAQARYRVTTSDRSTSSIWVAATSGEAGAQRGEIAHYQMTWGDAGPVVTGPSLRFSEFAEVHDVMPLDAQGMVVAVAAGAEGMVLLQKDALSGELKRIHRKNEPIAGVGCERVILSPRRDLVLAVYRDDRAGVPPAAFINIYDVMEDPKFPVFIQQVLDLPLVMRSGRMALPELTFIRGGDIVVFALGDDGVGLLDVSNPLAPFQMSYDDSLGATSLLDIDTAKAGEKLCVAAGTFGIYCAKVE